MDAAPDIIIIGAGSNGLVAAATLAKARKKVLVLERAEHIGGRTVTSEFHPGFRVSSGLHATCGLLPQVVSALDLERHGLELEPQDRGVTTLRAGQAPFHLPADPDRALDAAAKLSDRDVQGLKQVTGFLDRLVAFLRPLLTLQPIPLQKQRLTALLEPAWQALRLRWMGEKDMMELLRIAPQPLYDFCEDWFASDVLRATVAFPALIGSSVGPRAPGTVGNLLLREASSPFGRLRRGGQPKGGMGSITQALRRAAEHHGVEIRCAAPVGKILLDGTRACGVALEGGEELPARAVLSNASPKTTFLRLMKGSVLGPTIRRRLAAYRTNGSLAKVHFALGDLPTFEGGDVELGGHVQIGEGLDDLERAFDDVKYRRPSAKPALDITFPSVIDPNLAPQGKHVASVLVQSAPYELAEGEWSEQRDALGDAVQERIEAFAPGFTDSVVSREVLTPRDIEERFGLDGGHLFGGDLTLDQLFTNRPIPDCGTYATPVTNLFLTGSATHPGGHLTGAAGANAARRILKSWKAIARATK